MRRAFLSTLLLIIMGAAMLVPVAAADDAAPDPAGFSTPPPPPLPPAPTSPAPSDEEPAEAWLQDWIAANKDAVVTWYNENATRYIEENLSVERPPATPPEHPLPATDEDKIAWLSSFLNTMQPWIREEFLRFVLAHVESPDPVEECFRPYVFTPSGSRPLTPFPVCVGFRSGGCDVWVGTAFVTCARYFFPEDW